MRAAKTPKPKPPLEREVQDEIVKVLRLVRGIKVYQTSIRKGAGKDGMRGGGQDKGIPDLLVSVDFTPRMYIGLEVKRPGRVEYSSPEQKEAVESGRCVVVQSVQQAVWALLETLHNSMDWDPAQEQKRRDAITQLERLHYQFRAVA